MLVMSIASRRRAFSEATIATLMAGASQIVGVGTVSTPNSGALAAGSSVIDGIGTSGSTGTGALAADSSVIDGTGSAPSPPSYSNPLGTGDRTATITVTTTAILAAGTASNMVDGAFANNATDSFWWTGSQSGRRITFDLGSAKVIDEAKMYSDLTSAHGTWKWQGSNTNNGSDWVDLSAGFTLAGGPGGVVQGDLSANTTSYRYYSLLQTAGVTSAASWQREFEFKVSA